MEVRSGCLWGYIGRSLEKNQDRWGGFFRTVRSEATWDLPAVVYGATPKRLYQYRYDVCGSGEAGDKNQVFL